MGRAKAIGIAGNRDLFVGRAIELAQVRRLLRRRARLITLTGPPGIGKTRLSRRIAGERSRARPAFVYEIALGDCRELPDIVNALLRGLPAAGVGAGIPEHVGRVLDGLGDCLVVLDNFEQVVQHAAATLGRWLDDAPRAQFLVTSREPVGLRGEHVITLPPLSHNEAVQLFTDRAHAARHTFGMTAEDAVVVSDIVDRVDRIPLAIELAAAHAQTFSVTELRQRLAGHFNAVRASRRDHEPRHRTMAEAVLWSWSLLPAPEQQALALCSVFSGGFTADALCHVSAVAVDPVETERHLAALHSKSLLYRNDGNAQPASRFALYECVREFAEEQLNPDTRARAWLAHAEYYLRRGEALADIIRRSEGSAVLPELACERANLLAVVTRFANMHPLLSARAVLVLHPVFALHGPLGQHAQLLDNAVAWAERAGDEALLARLLGERGWVHTLRGGDPTADLRRGAELARRLNEARDEARCHLRLAEYCARSKRHPEALESIRRAMALFQEQGDVRGLAYSRQVAAGVLPCTDAHAFSRACSEYNAALALAREHALDRLEGVILNNFGLLLLEHGDLDGAEAKLQAALGVHQAENRAYESTVLDNLASLKLERGDWTAAEHLYAEAARLAESMGNRSTAASSLMRLGHTQLARGADDAAAASYTAALAHARELRQDSVTAQCSASLAALVFARGEVDRAKGLLERARGATGKDDTFLQHAVEIWSMACGAPGVVPRPGDFRGTGSLVARHAAAVCARLLAVRPSGGVRTLRLLTRSRSVVLPDGRTIDLHRRAAMWRVMLALVESAHSESAPGLTVHDLFERGWPGQNIPPDRGAHRVHVALNELRELGLRDLLVRRDDGYCLAPGTPVVVDDDAQP